MSTTTDAASVRRDYIDRLGWPGRPAVALDMLLRHKPANSHIEIHEYQVNVSDTYTGTRLLSEDYAPGDLQGLWVALSKLALAALDAEARP